MSSPKGCKNIGMSLSPSSKLSFNLLMLNDAPHTLSMCMNVRGVGGKSVCGEIGSSH